MPGRRPEGPGNRAFGFMSDRPITEPLVAAIRERVDGGESIAGLAARVGVTRANLSRLLAGKATVTIETADRIAAELGLVLTR